MSLQTMTRRQALGLTGGVGLLALGVRPGLAADLATLDVNANSLGGYWTAARSVTNPDNMERSKPHVIVNGVPGDEFDEAVVTFYGNGKSFGSIDSRESKELILRKRPGRTKYGHTLQLPAVQIPNPERDIVKVTVQVDLYTGQGSGDRLVASGTDVVDLSATAACVTNCLTK